tara:strand:- start:309 stop:656 length:348 start_codon:yes stop_codon:yes gene_type:complete
VETEIPIFVILVVLIVMSGIVAWRSAKLRATALGVGGSLFAILGALLFWRADRRRAGRRKDAAQTVKDTRTEGVEDAQIVRQALEAAIADEEDAHKAAQSEQEALQGEGRPKVKA